MADRWILWTIVLGYMVFIFVKGVSKARHIGDADDFLVAGRNIGWFFLFCTMGATVIGGGASIGAIGKTYDWGVLMLLVSTGWYLHFIFSGLVVAPQFRDAELYTVAGYFGHRFGEGPRFIILVLSLMFSVFIVAAQMAAFGSVLAAILPEFADAQNVLRWAIVIGGSMVVIYSTAGGLLAVIHTDVYQFVILMLGFLVTLGFCIPDIAGSYNAETGKFVPTRFGTIDLRAPEELAQQILNSPDALAAYLRDGLTKKQRQALEGAGTPTADPEALKGALKRVLNAHLDEERLYTPERFSGVVLTAQTRALIAVAAPAKRALRRRNLSLLQDTYPEQITRNRTIPERFFSVMGGKGWLFLVTTFLAFLLGETFAPGYATRYCVGKNIRETRFGIAGVGFFLAFTFPVVLFFIALYARIHYPDIEPQQALPMVIRQLNNPVIGGLIIGALLMAVMSSADSALNSSTAIFVKDLFEHQLGWQDDGKGRLLRLARISSAGLGGAAILVAILWPDIIGLLLFTYHTWAPAVIVPVCVGVFSQRRSRRLTGTILTAMLVATAATMAYRVILHAEGAWGWTVLGEGLHSLMQRFDASVFGVLVSALTLGVVSLGTRLLFGPAAQEAGQ